MFGVLNSNLDISCCGYCYFIYFTNKKSSIVHALKDKDKSQSYKNALYFKRSIQANEVCCVHVKDK